MEVTDNVNAQSDSFSEKNTDKGAINKSFDEAKHEEDSSSAGDKIENCSKDDTDEDAMTMSKQNENGEAETHESSADAAKGDSDQENFPNDDEKPTQGVIDFDAEEETVEIRNSTLAAAADDDDDNDNDAKNGSDKEDKQDDDEEELENEGREVAEGANGDDDSIKPESHSELRAKNDDEETPPPAPDSEPPTEEPPSYEDAVPNDEKADSSRSASPQPEADPEPDDEPEPMPVPQLDAVSEPITHKYHPRLCHIRKWPDFQGYGFNLHSEKDRHGQYIGLVDPGSPSEDADLRKGDRIIEVNGDNIEEEAHANVIQKIKAGGDETILLVVDIETDDYYKNNGIKITSFLPEVVRNETKPRDTPAMTYIPRLCHLVKWHDFNGYGFNLHAEKERGAQHIGKIDDNSPALAAGLREHDRIIEVNGVNIENETHQQVIARIKAGGDETKLLVVDKDADNHYKSRGVTVKSTMSEVKEISAMRRTAPAVATNGSPAPAPSHAPVQAPVSQPTRTIDENEEEPGDEEEKSPEWDEDSKKKAPSSPGDTSEDLFSMSAAEARNHLSHRKKSDKRINRPGMKEKLNIFEKL